MRNLKKILALVLALMMVLSVMVTSSAAFEDAAEIEHSEAVEVMSNLGILLGDGTNFNPNGTLTRAQAAVIIAKMLEGSVDNISVLVDAVDNPFTDVPAWALDYVLYAYSKGVVRGTSADKYTPGKNLTGYEFGKMVLVAAGICKDADFNNNWKMVVAEKLNAHKLMTGLSDLVLSKDLSREHAAQLAFNAMNYGTTTNYGYAVKDSEGNVLGYYPTLIEAAQAAKLLSDATETFTYDRTPTKLPNDSLATIVFGLGTNPVDEGIGFEGYKWYVDVDASGAYNADKDVYVSSFICTDTVVGTFTKANSWKEVAAALGKKTTFPATTYANGTEGAVWNINPTNTAKCGTDSDVTLTVAVDANKNVKLLYAREYLTVADRSTKVADKNSPYYGLYTWNFKHQTAQGAVVDTVYAAADAYTHGATYLVVPTLGAPVVTATAPIVGVITGKAADDSYIRVDYTTAYTLSDTGVTANVNALQPVSIYLNSAGDVIYVGAVGASAPTVYDGHIYVKGIEYIATPYSATGLVGAGSNASITAKATVVTPAGEELVVDLATKVEKVGNTYVPKFYLNGWQTANTNGKVQSLVGYDTDEVSYAYAPAWFAYTVENGVYALDSQATSTITGAANKKAVVYVDDVKCFMDANTEITFYYYNLSSGKMETYTNTGYANYNSGNFMNDEQAVVVADPATNVISSITFYCEKVDEDVVNYAVYAGLIEEGPIPAYNVYGFYVDGALKYYYSAADLSGLTENVSLVTFKTDALGTVTDATEITNNAVIGGYTYRVYTNNVIDAIAADGSYVVCGRYVNYMNSYGCLILDGTNSYALGELAVGQTITIVDNGYGNTVIIITAQPPVE